MCFLMCRIIMCKLMPSMLRRVERSVLRRSSVAELGRLTPGGSYSAFSALLDPLAEVSKCDKWCWTDLEDLLQLTMCFTPCDSPDQFSDYSNLHNLYNRNHWICIVMDLLIFCAGRFVINLGKWFSSLRSEISPTGFGCLFLPGLVTRWWPGLMVALVADMTLLNTWLHNYILKPAPVGH